MATAVRGKKTRASMLALVAGLTLSVFFTPISAEASTGSSVSGTGTIATPGPWIPCSLWELDLRVTGKTERRRAGDRNVQTRVPRVPNRQLSDRRDHRDHGDVCARGG